MEKRKNQAGAVLVKLGPDKARLDALAKDHGTKPTPLAAALILDGISKLEQKRISFNAGTIQDA